VSKSRSGYSHAATTKEAARPSARCIPLKHYAYSNEKTYVYWAQRYIYFHDVRHPSEMGALEVEAFLTHLAVKQNAAAQGQGLPGLHPLPHRAVYALRPPDERGAATRY
jgi:hypothetical protein